MVIIHDPATPHRLVLVQFSRLCKLFTSSTTRYFASMLCGRCESRIPSISEAKHPEVRCLGRHVWRVEEGGLIIVPDGSSPFEVYNWSDDYVGLYGPDLIQHGGYVRFFSVLMTTLLQIPHVCAQRWPLLSLPRCAPSGRVVGAMSRI